MKKAVSVFLVIIIVALVAVVGFAAYLVLQHARGVTTNNGTPVPNAAFSSTPSFKPTGMLHVQGPQIIDASGHSIVLRGAQIESPFNYMKNWERGVSPTQMLNSSNFNAMVHDWHMNTLRLPISNWIYAKYPSDYLSQLDQVVHQANTAGLYVVLDLHDNVKAGSPYTAASTLPKTEDITFWKTIAAHYKTNPMVMFDVYNEPQANNWDTWLHGGGKTQDGATIVGFQDLVDAIRSTGAQQIIVVEPGAAGGKGNGVFAAQEGGWASFPISHAIADPSIVYSLHVYNAVTFPPQQQSAKWGPILNHYPLYYGEWAFLPNAYGQAHCQNLPTNPAQADQTVTNFLNYMASIHASWTAWAFEPHYLVQNYHSYAPTTLDTSWTCGDTKADVGMGTIVKQYLTANG